MLDNKKENMYRRACRLLVHYWVSSICHEIYIAITKVEQFIKGKKMESEVNSFFVATHFSELIDKSCRAKRINKCSNHIVTTWQCIKTSVP
jgi:hypothetical protein